MTDSCVLAVLSLILRSERGGSIPSNAAKFTKPLKDSDLDRDLARRDVLDLGRGVLDTRGLRVLAREALAGACCICAGDGTAATLSDNQQSIRKRKDDHLLVNEIGMEFERERRLLLRC
jgi:hypothetical protein